MSVEGPIYSNAQKIYIFTCMLLIIVPNLKITLVNDQRFSSGTFNYFFQLYQNLKEHGYYCDFHQFLISNEIFDKSREILIARGLLAGLPNGRKEIYNFKLAINFLSGHNWRVFKNLEAELLLLSGPSLLPLTKRYKKTIVIGHDLYFMHNNDDSKILNYYMKKTYKSFKDAYHIVVNSIHTENEFVRYLGFDKSKISVIYPSIDESVFYPGNSDIRTQLNFKPDEKIILSVGGDNPNKNIETVLKVLDSLPENYKLIRVGRNYNTTDLIKKYNLTNRVVTFNEVEIGILADLYRTADVFLFPSLSEGFGIPVVEAMASGTPVIVSNRGALPEVVGDAAFVCDPFDLDCLYNSIISITTDRILYGSLIEKGIKRSKKFSKEEQFKSLEALFGKFMEKYGNFTI